MPAGVNDSIILLLTSFEQLLDTTEWRKARYHRSLLQVEARVDRFQLTALERGQGRELAGRVDPSYNAPL